MRWCGTKWYSDFYPFVVRLVASVKLAAIFVDH